MLLAGAIQSPAENDAKNRDGGQQPAQAETEPPTSHGERLWFNRRVFNGWFYG